MVLQVLNISSLVAISLSSPEHSEATSSHCIHIGATIGKQFKFQNIQHAAIICKAVTGNSSIKTL